MHRAGVCAGICLAAFAPVGITIASQVLEIQKQLSKRFEDEDSDDDEVDDAEETSTSNPLDPPMTHPGE